MSQARRVVDLLGGNGNIVTLESCITRLRVQVNDPSQVDADGLRAAGAHGVVVSGRVIQVVVGPEADQLAEEIAAVRA
ncbi:MAG: PTS glucose/sucrose transporter subunit IIB [Bifidobacteriaceae bacterium]|jgi:PTS system N-acetylglucosamine-specific IIB component|nr:PTS glucose/sucrose transporter subunit IIB [Bifidobacteriaceae bacterium]